jgi:hypothetical protein
MSVSRDLMYLAADGSIGNLVNGLAPDWGPFGALGTTARTVVEALMAGVVVALLGRATLGAFSMKIGEREHDTAQVSKGKKEVGGALVGAFIVASLGTIFTIVYGMGI